MKLIAPITAAIALAAIALPAYAVLTFVPRLDPAAMQVLATSACKCARAVADPGAKKKCWSPFEKLLPINPERIGGTTCAPLSRRSYAVPGTEKDVILGYHIVAADAPELCSKEEAIAGEALYYGLIYQGKTWDEQLANIPRADAALQQFAEELARGRTTREVAPLMGCTTGHY